jgi:membrane associated rhomboid family serine protease
MRLCAEKAPDPWYPSDYAKETGTPRDSLDPYLDQLRMGGLTRLTDWVAGHGQGYALTPAGEELLKNPRQLARLLAGKWSPPVVRENRPTATASSPWERGEAVRAALLYPVSPVVTFVLMIINISAFVVQCQSSQFQNLLIASPTGLLEKEWWRLLTTAFLHAVTLGFPWHLAMNMMALYSLGRITEQLWGHARYLAIYIVGALGSTCLALISRLNPPVGASGAVCALFAAWAVWFFFNRQHLPPRLFFAWQRTFLINVVLLVLISLFPGVSWEGHLGGAIAGFALALWFSYFQVQTGWRRWPNLVGVILIPALSIGLLVRTMNRSNHWREVREEVEREEINSFLPAMSSTEQKANKIFLNEVNPLLEQRADRRQSQELTEALNHVADIIQDLREAAELLRQRKPFATTFVERVRQLRLQLTEAWITLLQLSKECLQKGEDCTEKEEQGLKQQEEQLAKLKSEWREMLESSRRH